MKEELSSENLMIPLPTENYFLELMNSKEFKNKSFTQRLVHIENICYYFLDRSIYFNYFLSLEDERKENLFLAYESIYYSRLKYLFLGFTIFMATKSIIMRNGYFSHFLFHTRFFPWAIFAMSVYFIDRNFKANLQNNNILRYYEKKNSYQLAGRRIEELLIKKNILKNNTDLNYGI